MNGIQPEDFVATVRRRNQLTIPKLAADLLGLQEGDVVVIAVKNGRR